MRVVGIRELENRLSEYLRRVRGGEEILVTDRGRVVAELRPPGSAGRDLPYPRLEAWVRRGAARPGAANDPELYPDLEPALGAGSAAELLDLERRER